jgi:hypothetical protein
VNPQVFISYSSKDKAVGDAACARLEARGYGCWIAPRDIRPGREWGEAIVEGIAGCRVFVLIFSTNANESPQIRREIERAVHHGLVVLPFRIEDVAPVGSLEYFMSVPHWLDAMTPPLEQHLQELADVVARVIDGEADPCDFAPRLPLAAGPAWVLITAVALLIAAPLLAALAAFDPPWPANLGYVSAALVAGAAAAAHFGPQAIGLPAVRTLRWLIPALVLVGLVAYLALASLVIEAIPGSGVRVVKGFACTPDALLVYGDSCPGLSRDALRDAEWEAATLWTGSSLLVARLSLVSSWLVLVAGLALGAAALVRWRRSGRRGGP